MIDYPLANNSCGMKKEYHPMAGYNPLISGQGQPRRQGKVTSFLALPTRGKDQRGYLCEPSAVRHPLRDTAATNRVRCGHLGSPSSFPVTGDSGRYPVRELDQAAGPASAAASPCPCRASGPVSHHV